MLFRSGESDAWEVNCNGCAITSSRVALDLFSGSRERYYVYTILFGYLDPGKIFLDDV